MLQNFLVAIRDDCTPRMICAFVILCSSHGMSRLHVCVDFSFVPFGIVAVIECRAIFMLTTGAPLIMKWLVTPESDTVDSTSLVMYLCRIPLMVSCR